MTGATTSLASSLPASSLPAPTPAPTPAAGPRAGRPAPTTEGSPLRVRPYVVTGGRTGSGPELPLEATLRVTVRGGRELGRLTLERLRIVESCQDRVPVAELAARLGLPVQVIRVLVGDLITEGLIEVDTSSGRPDQRPDLALLQRVLDGLQHL